MKGLEVVNLLKEKLALGHNKILKKKKLNQLTTDQPLIHKNNSQKLMKPSNKDKCKFQPSPVSFKRNVCSFDHTLIQ